MANYVDFSNAHIECLTGDVFSESKFGIDDMIAGTGYSITSIGGVGSANSVIATNVTKYYTNINPYGFSLVVDGIFNQSGNCFYIRSGKGITPAEVGGSWRFGWKVSNISFEAGDHFSFQININIICS